MRTQREFKIFTIIEKMSHLDVCIIYLQVLQPARQCINLPSNLDCCSHQADKFCQLIHFSVNDSEGTEDNATACQSYLQISL